MGLLPLETGGEGYHAPSPDDFNLPPLFPDVPWLAWLDKYMLQALVATILIIIFWLVVARKRQMVPEQGPVHRRDGVLLRPQLDRPGQPSATTSASSCPG